MPSFLVNFAALHGIKILVNRNKNKVRQAYKSKSVTGKNYKKTNLHKDNFEPRVKAIGGGVNHFFLLNLTLAFILKLSVQTTSYFL